MVFRKMSLSCLCLSLFLIVSAQRSVSFKIIDEETSKPLEEVNIKVPKFKLAKISDDSGYVSFSNLPPGMYDVEFSETEYEEKEIQLKLNDTYADTTIIVLLSPEEQTLQDVTVVSTRSNNRITDEPQRVEILGKEEVNEELNIHPGNISKLLGENAGIQTQQTSAVSGNMTFRILGLEGNYTQLLKDGFPLYGGLSNGLSILSIPPLDLQQVEIIKGASSDLYGGNAMAGVINLISVAPTEGKPTLSMMLSQSLKGGSDINAFYSHRSDHIGFTFMASASSQQPKDIDNDVFTDLPYLRQINLAPKLFWYINDSTKLVLGLNASWEDRKGGDIYAINNHPDSIHSYIEESKSNRQYSTMLFESHLHNATIFTIKNSICYFNRNLSLPGYHFDGTEWNTWSEASLLKTWQSNKLVSGLSFYTDKFAGAEALPANNFNYDYATPGAFLQDTWTIISSWILQAGLRADDHNKYGFYLLPRFALLYKATKDLSFRGGYGRGYNIPTTINSISSQDELQYAYPIGNTVMPEIAGSWNADIFYNSHLSDEWSISFDQAFYYTTVQHPVIPQADSLAIGKYFFINASAPLKAKGFETNVRVASDDLEFLIGYARLDVRKQYDTLQSLLELTPKNKVFFSAVYELENNFRCGTELDFIGSQYLSNGTQSKPYTLIGLMAQKTLGHFTLVANAENILNVRQIKYGSLYKGSLQKPAFNDIYAPLDGVEINFVLKVTL
jgi:outer membrane receptor protein involved in Fe transport